MTRQTEEVDNIRSLKGPSDSDSDSDSEIETNAKVSVHPKTLVEKEDIVTKYADKIKTDPLKKGPKITKDRSNRATVEQVLDPRTMKFLAKIINKGVLSRINGCISTGKEANVYHGTIDTDSSKEYAVKIYKTSILVFKDRERYVDGEFRFRNSKNQNNPRKMVKIWAEKEFRNLKRIFMSGCILCPEPVELKSHVLVMEYLTKGNGEPSPKLKDHNFKDVDEVVYFYQTMVVYMRWLYQKCRLIHADLSEYNSIVHKGKLHIIDVSQSVEPDHPMALDFLRMDIKNVNDFFNRKKINVYPERLIFKFIIDNEIKEDSENLLRDYLNNLPLKIYDEQEVHDEIFRSLHLLRSLNNLDERDFDKFSEGKVDTMKDLVANKIEEENTNEEAQSENDSDSESQEDSEEEDDDSDLEAEEKEWIEKEEEQPKGKKFEDKDEKKARKEAAKLAKQEKRKTKMKKNVKKKLINKRKTVLFQFTSALHFYVKTGETKCFYEELPEDTLLVGKIDAYELNEQSHEYYKNHNLKVQITIEETFDNNHLVADQKSQPDGDFTFTSFDSGEHKFCLTPIYTDNTKNKQHRIFFDLIQGSSHDYIDSKSTKSVDELILKVNDLYNQLDKIHYEQEHMREREAAFRDQSESTNSRVVKWSIVQLFVLVGTCVYQLRHLKSFFVKQKIV
ncbi:unnamed protein product [Candida verbasci]|uniref:Serine/threonine-protein kinase RIO1 n=1 Tax=Candida verbasci TaxID=1227364 RepID=A0A9W4XKE5_9ASCO|nr:unnamed protein product [Candida verbasci]